MSTLILTLDQHEMDPSVKADDRENYYKRVAVRAVLSDSEGRIALMYARQRGYYKLPGGGVDKGEDLLVALERELLEETGSKVTVIKELGRVIEWRDLKRMNQTSYSYQVALVGETGQPSFTHSEIDEGFEMRWIDTLDNAIELVESKTDHADIEVVFMAKRDVAILRAAK